nr:hypothetical protein [Tanacetum cinerariifolium]
SNLSSNLSTPQNIASTFSPLLSEAQFDAFTDFEAQQHHNQATGGSLIYEHPPIPNHATPPVSTTEGAAEVPFTTDQMLALFPMCLQKINALEKELKATKRLNRDTVLLFHKRIQKLEAKVKTKSKRKLVISDSEEEEAAKDYAELEKLISLADTAVNKPSSFVTPSKTTAADSSQKEDITPQEIEQERLSMMEIDRLKAQDEEERKKRLVDLSKSDSEYAKQVAQMMETSHTEPAPQVPATGPLPSIERQRDLDDMIASFSNTEWMILMAKVKDFPKVAKEILGADVNDDNFSS